MNKKHSSEKGQILVFLALVLVGLLGFTALAIDGGMVFADQRYSQSAADAASLAGAGAAAAVIDDLDMSTPEWNCSQLTTSIANAYTAAISKAAANDYVIAKDTLLGSDDQHNHGVKVTCFDSAKYIAVEVMLTKDTDTSFVHLFNNGDMQTTVYSKSIAKPRVLGSGGASIVSLGKNCGSKVGGVWFSGTNDTLLTSGGVYSNSCVDRNSGASTVTINDGTVTYHEGSYSAGISDPVPVADANYHPYTEGLMGGNQLPFTEKNCEKLPIQTSVASGTLDPGRYSGWDFKGPVKLNPGLYCVTGDIKMNASAWVYNERTYDANGDMPGVTIYFTGTSLTLNGGADTELLAPNGYVLPDTPPNYAVEDLLLYIPNDVLADVTINGNANNTFAGELYMPASTVKINGTAGSESATSLTCAIIGYWVTLTGASDFKISYDPNMVYSFPATIQLQK